MLLTWAAVYSVSSPGTTVWFRQWGDFHSFETWKRVFWHETIRLSGKDVMWFTSWLADGFPPCGQEVMMWCDTDSWKQNNTSDHRIPFITKLKSSSEIGGLISKKCHLRNRDQRWVASKVRLIMTKNSSSDPRSLRRHRVFGVMVHSSSWIPLSRKRVLKMCIDNWVYTPQILFRSCAWHVRVPCFIWRGVTELSYNVAWVAI